MDLPFTREQFFDLFLAYNEALWPALVALWVASAGLGVLLLLGRPGLSRWISALLAWHWAWSALAYHAAFFTRINPAAWLFAALFLFQAFLFLWVGVVRGRVSFAGWSSPWAPLAWGLVGYSLAYPMINAVVYRSGWRIPAFGVPCPTTILTIGLLLLAMPRSWSLSAVPVLWSAIGASAAPLLGVRADYALALAGVVLVVVLLKETARNHFRRLVIIGLTLMAVGVIDPLEGSMVILGGSVLIALGTVFSRGSYRVPLLALLLIGGGVSALFVISSLGGVGGNTGRSLWWLLLCAPDPLGWILGLVGGVRALRQQRHA
ncbi:MAG TPA: DUF6064 family protein [Vicinamibacterales bacterium]|nr:DUF6064 family protein [Vicinamibacterales bacterium]